MRRLLAFLALLPLIVGCNPAPSPPPFEPAWVTQTSSTTARLQALSAVNEDMAWASGVAGTFARTTDGGETWQTGVVPDADTLQFRDVHAVDAETAYLLSAGTGRASRIYKTVDAGQSWALQFVNDKDTGFFSCMAFWDDQRGVAFSDAVDGRIQIIRTENGGASWDTVPEANVPPALPGEGGFAASGTCIVTQPGGYAWIGTGASGLEARVFRSTDHGQTWQVTTTPIASNSRTSGIFSLAFRDARHGVALGGDYDKPDQRQPNVARTQDGGQTWTMVGTTQIGGSVFGASYVPGTGTPTLVAVAPTGSDVSTDEGQTWARIDTVNYWAVTFISPTAGWAVGPEGRIVKVAPAGP